MASDDPAFLSKGVEVSAKYKGAFCEAKVKHVEKSVKCKVILKEDGKSLIVSDEDIRGALKVGAVVEVRKQPDGGHYVEATISRITDHSLYTVIFDDGDENTLRRSKLCLKGDRHFMKSETLDDLPLTNPEHFSTPVIRKTSGSKASKARAASDSDDNSDSSSDSSGNEDSDCRSGSQSKSVTNERSYMKNIRDFVGQVFCVEVEDRAKKSTMLPCLVVLPTADELQLTSSRHMLVKSFKDNKFITTTFDASRLYSAGIAATKMAACKDKTVKLAWEKAQQYIEHQELPTAWEKDSLLGTESDSEEQTSDCEVPAMDERRDPFVARLYKFMEESGTPLNKGPTLDGNDIDLFHLFELVSNMGGYNRVTNMSRWPSVFLRLKLSCSLTIGAAAKHVQDSYKKYLYAYEDINRKLGCTLVSTLNRPDRGRHPSSRSLVSFRDRERLDRPVESLLKSATRIASKRSSSVKDEPSTPTASGPDDSLLIPQLVKERDTKETEDSDKMEKPDVKSDDSQQRLTRKTPKRPQLDAPNILPASVEMKDLDSSSQVKDPTQKVAGANKPAIGERNSLIRQRRPSAVMRLTRVDVLKKAQTNISGPSSEARSGDKKSTLGGNGGNDQHKFSGKLSIGKDARLGKKTPSDVSESRAGKSDFKHDEKVLKRPILRRESSSSRMSADRVSVNSTTDQNTTAKEKEDTDKVLPSKSSGAEEGYAIGTRLRVRYGKAPNLKIYEAKVLDKRSGSGTSAIEYYVHYAGWNNRYDEWIRRDAIVSVIEEPAEGVVLSAPTNVSSVATKSRPVSSIGSIISRAAEKKKAPNLYLKSYTGGLLSNAKKVRKFIDPNAGGDGQHTDKVHKRMPTLNPIKGVARQTSASSKVPHRRARTRSRTLDAEESESERSSSSDSESDTGSKGSSHMKGGSPTRSPPSLGSPKSKIQPKTEPELPDICDATSDSSKNTSEDKSVKEPPTEVKTAVDKDVSEMAKTDALLTSPVNVSIKRESIAEEGVNLSPFKTQLESASEVEIKEESVAHQVEAVKENEKDGSGASHVTASEATSSMSAVEVSVKTPESLEDKTKSGRGKKRPLVETEKPDKKGKSDAKKVGKDAHGSDRETDDRKESSDDSELPKVVVIEGTNLAGEETEESKEVLTTSKDKESTAEGDQKISSDEETEHDSRSAKRKKSKGKTLDKTPKAVGKGNADKPETPRAKKQVKNVQNDSKNCDLNSQDSQCSELESAVEKDLCDAELDKEKDDSSSAAESNAQPATTSETSPSSFDKAAAATKAAAAASLAAMSGLGMLASVSKSKDWKSTVEGSGGDGSQDEETQKSSSEGSRNVFEDAVKAIPSSCFREEVDTMSVLQQSTPCHQPTMFTDSPPDSSESDEFGGPSPSGGSASPTGPTGDEERTSTKSELEANMEVAAYMGGTSNGGETSSDDDDNDDYEENRSQSRHHTKGAGIKRRSDIELAHESFTTTSKRLKQDKQQHHHRTRASHNRLAAVAKMKNQGVSDSDDVDSTPAAPVKQSVSTATPASSGSTNTSSAHKIYRIAEPRPLTKYNFLDLEEGQYLEGEERITFLMSKIQELRQVYMDLKAEVACIDRRRRRHRMKEKEAQATHSSVNVSAVSAGGGSSTV